MFHYCCNLSKIEGVESESLIMVWCRFESFGFLHNSFISNFQIVHLFLAKRSIFSSKLLANKPNMLDHHLIFQKPEMYPFLSCQNHQDIPYICHQLRHESSTCKTIKMSVVGNYDVLSSDKRLNTI